FVRRVRIERVRELLAGTTDPLSAIAFSTGFSDQSHLTRQFRAVTGMTPAEYRRRHG
ncbi:MAG: helix-turn-helix domain-containing protein, partial [Gemmatimonadaceae bacterium]